jgi:hypothetical protein
MNCSTVSPASATIRRSVPDRSPLVVGNNGPGVRLIATKNHVAALLAAEDEPDALEGRPDFKTG